MPKKIYNPEPKEAVFRSLLVSQDEVCVKIPAKDFVVVSDGVASVLQAHYANLEVNEASNEDYADYRAKKERLEKEEAERKERLEKESLRLEKEKLAAAEELNKSETRLVEPRQKGRPKKLK